MPSSAIAIHLAPAAKPTVGREKSNSAGPTSRRMFLGSCLLQLPRAAWMFLDLVVLCVGTDLGRRFFVDWASAPAFAEYNLWVTNIVLASSVILAGSVSGLYESGTLWARSRILVRCVISVTIAMLSTWLVLHLLMYTTLSRRSAASGIAFFLIMGSSIRLLAHYAIRDVRRGLLVIGQGPLTGTIIRSVRRGTIRGYHLVGLVNDGAVESSAGDLPIVGGIRDIEALCQRYDVADVVVAENAARNPMHLRAALTCLRLGCRVTDETTFYETTNGEVPVSYITPNWFLAADLKGQRREHGVVKRFWDVVIAGAGLGLALPVMLIIALALKLQGRGSALYSQTRVGWGGRPFTLHKFRTMVEDAEAGGSVWASENDPRVTPLGRLLRRSRLDELPQLWNILKGDMSLVGPRPERPEFVSVLSASIPFYDERHLVKPGLTGWAQINYPYGSSMVDARRKLQLDLYYIKHTSFELDLIVLLRTVGTFFRGSR